MSVATIEGEKTAISTLLYVYSDMFSFMQIDLH